jgi:diketogulonate reductase-like aldo/keto reductase
MGFGTSHIESKEPIVTAILEAGYRHIDTASCYQTEEFIGEALQEVFSKGVKREEMFITTKIWQDEYADVEGAIKKSLKKLKLDYVDMYLIHWPAGYFAEPRKPLYVMWPEMEALVEKGLTKGIGVSNFNTQLLWDMMCYCKITPACNQIELNPQCA